MKKYSVLIGTALLTFVIAVAVLVVSDIHQAAGPISVAERNMILLPGGTFTMGCREEAFAYCPRSELPAHRVTLDAFYLAKYEVTQELWFAVTEDDDFPMKFQDCPTCPANCVSWLDTQKFLRKLNEKTGKNYRLPTEAEWEYAAAEGANPRYLSPREKDETAWYLENSGKKLHSVGMLQPNYFGLYDMTGNVSEWTNDWYVAYDSLPQINPQGGDGGDRKVMRGACWFCPAREVSMKDRNRRHPEQHSFAGFRLAHDG